MNSKFNLKFWQRDYIERFQLDREGREIFNFLIHNNPISAEQFIKDKYARDVYRLDIIDKYCDRYDKAKINKLLNDLEFDLLSDEEVKEYEIKDKNKREEEFE